MMGHKICFHGEIWLVIPKLSLLPLNRSADPLDIVSPFLSVTSHEAKQRISLKRGP